MPNFITFSFKESREKQNVKMLKLCSLSAHELLFRHIFETQIHIQTDSKKLYIIHSNEFSLTTIKVHAFSISNTFISNAWLKLAKIQANAKQPPEAELLLFDNYSHSSSTLSSRNNRTYSEI